MTHTNISWFGSKTATHARVSTYTDTRNNEGLPSLLWPFKTELHRPEQQQFKTLGYLSVSCTPEADFTSESLHHWHAHSSSRSGFYVFSSFSSSPLFAAVCIRNTFVLQRGGRERHFTHSLPSPLWQERQKKKKKEKKKIKNKNGQKGRKQKQKKRTFF